MLYELITIVRPGRLSEIKEIAHTAGKLILAQRGVVRSLSNWGIYMLPNPIKKNQTRYDTGHHFVMRFDSALSTQEEVRRLLAADPRVLRYGVVKLGRGTLADGAKYGDVRWTRKPIGGDVDPVPSRGLFDIV